MDDTTKNWNGLSEASAAQAREGDRISYELSYAEALEILRLVDTSATTRKLSLAIGDFQIDIKRDAGKAAPVSEAARPAPKTTAAAPQTTAADAAASAAPTSAAPAAEPASPEGSVSAVRSPIAGVFYRAPAPGEPAFVEVGDTVSAETVVGIVEVMKVMNNIRAGADGVIAEICVDNEELVQFDQTLFYVKTDSEATLS
ncbi:acetyl-CoA carboxylase biotin carboxyl carrier protein [Pseudohoeflea coraliihabitans]|uniref:Biotin carboxyl carrier protein of acetyl-CoA carboxylase n=1 Tax=Pseudohoeflea coraliihabitans TaxID=2860393 RepID=A0ABS6WMV5_9HYPH|nr:acetyl-CoA carboxylase biotin carboxyl carrier protein [Pseudohoeflea sp. DP4N28-3]MBW3096435.1 acetyl-CoA carboxylase biotin carboxyl carrier protein [Pseudohoeflea sp. DP4N28-3]